MSPDVLADCGRLSAGKDADEQSPSSKRNARSRYSFGILLCAICFTPIQPVAIHIAALCAAFIFRQHFFRTLLGAANTPIIIAEVFCPFHQSLTT